MEQDRMSRLMIGCDLLFFVRNNLTSFLCADTDLDKGMFDILLCNVGSRCLRRHNCSLIHEVLKVCTCKACGCLCDLCQINILTQRLVLDMNAKNLLTSLDIRSADSNLTVETSRTQDCRIKNIHTVGSCHDDDSLIHSKTIHLHKKLIQSLLSLIMAAAHTGSTLSRNCIDLINKNNTRCMFLALFKQVTDTGGADTDKHLHKIRTGNGKERNTCFTCYSFGKKSLTCSWRTYKDNAFRDSCTHACIFLRSLEEIHHLYQIFLLFLKTCHILEGYFLIVRKHHSRTALAKIHHLGIAAST